MLSINPFIILVLFYSSLATANSDLDVVDRNITELQNWAQICQSELANSGGTLSDKNKSGLEQTIDRAANHYSQFRQKYSLSAPDFLPSSSPGETYEQAMIRNANVLAQHLSSLRVGIQNAGQISDSRGSDGDASIDSIEDYSELEAGIEQQCGSIGEIVENDKVQFCNNLKQQCINAGNSGPENCSQLLSNLNAIENGNGTGSLVDTDGDGIGDTPANLQEPSVDPVAIEQAYNESCKPKETKADQCCGYGALGCAFGMDTESMGAQLVGVGGAMITAGAMYGAQNAAQICKRVKTLGYTSAALNTAMAAKCQSEIGQCKSSCGEVINRFSRDIQACEQYQSTRQTRLSSYSDCGKVLEYARLAERKAETCSSYTARQGQFIQSIATSVMGAKSAENCQEVVQATPVPPPPTDGDWTCTDPANYSNPYCVAERCQNPANANLPECQGNTTPPPNFNNTPGGGGYPGGVYAGGEEDPGEMLPTQTPEFQNFDPQSQAAVGGAGGGGSGGLGGGGGGGGFGSGTGASTAGADKGLNTDIFQGERGGSGYRVSGGGSGYQSGGATGKRGTFGYVTDETGKKFNLKDFLPKPKKGERRIAGIAGRNDTEIASKHGNIWKQISNKYKEMCIRNALWCTSGPTSNSSRTPARSK